MKIVSKFTRGIISKGWYRIVDDSGEDYLYPPEKFEVVS